MPYAMSALFVSHWLRRCERVGGSVKFASAEAARHYCALCFTAKVWAEPYEDESYRVV